MCFVCYAKIVIRKMFCYSVRTKNQIRFLKIDENECLNPNNEKRPVGVEFYLIDSNGENNSYMNEEFVNLLGNYQFDYKLNVRTGIVQI